MNEAGEAEVGRRNGAWGWGTEYLHLAGSQERRMAATLKNFKYIVSGKSGKIGYTYF